MTREESNALYKFCCFGCSCKDCPFRQIVDDNQTCGLSNLLYLEEYSKIMRIIRKNKKYERGQIENNPKEWEEIRHLFLNVTLA